MTKPLAVIVLMMLINGRGLAGPAKPATDTAKLCKDLTGASGVAALCDELSKGVINLTSTPACKDWSKQTVGCSLSTLCGLIKGGAGGALAGIKCVAGQWIVGPLSGAQDPIWTALEKCADSLVDDLTCKNQPGFNSDNLPHSCESAAYRQPCNSSKNPCDDMNCQLKQICVASGGATNMYCLDQKPGWPFPCYVPCGGYTDPKNPLCPTVSRLQDCNLKCNQTRNDWCRSQRPGSSPVKSGTITP
jgi:hypothetical protein